MCRRSTFRYSTTKVGKGNRGHTSQVVEASEEKRDCHLKGPEHCAWAFVTFAEPSGLTSVSRAYLEPEDDDLRLRWGGE